MTQTGEKRGRAILMCAGEYEEMEIPHCPEDLIVAVDGGLARLLGQGIEPDLVLGDFDSLGEEFLHSLSLLEAEKSGRLFRLPCEKDDTDTMFAARLCIERGYRELIIYGGLGKRLDHTLANIQTLTWIKKQGADAYLLGRRTCVSVLREEKVLLPPEYGGIFSLFALDASVRGISISGMKYPLENAELTNAFPLGVSNEVLRGAEAAVTVGTGCALMILESEDPCLQEIPRKIRRTPLPAR